MLGLSSLWPTACHHCFAWPQNAWLWVVMSPIESHTLITMLVAWIVWLLSLSSISSLQWAPNSRISVCASINIGSNVQSFCLGLLSIIGLVVKSFRYPYEASCTLQAIDVAMNRILKLTSWPVFYKFSRACIFPVSLVLAHFWKLIAFRQARCNGILCGFLLNRPSVPLSWALEQYSFLNWSRFHL